MFYISLFAVIFSAFGHTQDTNLKCTTLANRYLDGMHYGSFSRFSAGVTKSRLENGAYRFEAPGGPTLVFSEGKIFIHHFIFGMTTTTNIEFDNNCAITSVSGGNMNAAATSVSVANPSECKRLRLVASAPTPMLKLQDLLSLAWCGEYFPEKKPTQEDKKKTPQQR